MMAKVSMPLHGCDFILLTSFLSELLPIPPQLSDWPCLRSLTLQIYVEAEAIQRAIDILRYFRSTGVRKVSVDLGSRLDVSSLYRQCRHPANTELLAELEKAILEYPANHVSVSATRTRALHARKCVSWSKELGQCFPAMRRHSLPAMNFHSCKSTLRDASQRDVSSVPQREERVMMLSSLLSSLPRMDDGSRLHRTTPP